MKPISKAIRRIYDINCKRSCGLGVGLSERFETNVRNQQYNKKSKLNTPTPMFDDPEKQRKFQPIINDVLFKTLMKQENLVFFEGSCRWTTLFDIGKKKSIFENSRWFFIFTGHGMRTHHNFNSTNRPVEY